MRLAEPAIADALFSLGYDGPTSRLYEGWQSTDPSVPLDTADTMTLEDAAEFIRTRWGLVIQLTYADYGRPGEWFLSVKDIETGDTEFFQISAYETHNDALEMGVEQAVRLILEEGGEK